MGRKKTANARLKPAFRPFCYYCDRDFDNEKILIQHQKLRHFQCCRCHRKSDTAQGLVGHMMQVHRDNMLKVPNALPDRDDPEIVIRGTEGIPRHILMQKAKGTVLEDELLKERELEQAMIYGGGLDTNGPSLTHMVGGYAPVPPHMADFPYPHMQFVHTASTDVSMVSSGISESDLLKASLSGAERSTDC